MDFCCRDGDHSCLTRGEPAAVGRVDASVLIRVRRRASEIESVARARRGSEALSATRGRRQRVRCRRAPIDPRPALRARIGLFGKGEDGRRTGPVGQKRPLKKFSEPTGLRSCGGVALL
jgi:hypothetical protein